MPRRALSVRFAGLLRSRMGMAVVIGSAALVLALLVWPELRAVAWALAAGQREPLRAWLDGLGPLAPLASLAIAVTQSVLEPLPGCPVPCRNRVPFCTS